MYVQRGLSGLQANSAAIETASKNIASSNVVGFKSTEFLFSEALARSMSGSSGGSFAPAGTGALTRGVFAGGATRYSASPLDLSINGEGMFSLTLMQDGSSERVYTRNGQFLTDKDGNIVNVNGLYLLGFPEDNGVIDLSKAKPLKMPASPVSANTTTNANISVNLDARKPSVSAGGAGSGSLDVKNPNTYSHSTFLTIYDKVGKQHTLALYYQKADSVETAGEGGATSKAVTYNVYATIDGQAFVGGATPLNGTAGADAAASSTSVVMPNALVRAEDGTFVPAGDFDAKGKLVMSTPTKILTTLTFEAGLLKRVGATEVKANSNATVKISLLPPTGAPYDPTVALDDPLSFDFSFFGTSNFASAFEVKDIAQDGYAAGSLTGLSIDETGLIRGQYSNGRSVVAGQIMLSTFPALNGLREVSPSIYRATDGAGISRSGSPGSSVFGTIRSQSLEEGNVDMASELVKLMVQQRNYQANAQSIRAQDELLTTTIQMSR
ncbi:MAG: flagellar hook protein FlgE [Betaproteobacteria bacterium]|nr:flagellar hook protein FlgE [Betaproteobacteria bacterium]